MQGRGSEPGGTLDGQLTRRGEQSALGAGPWGAAGAGRGRRLGAGRGRRRGWARRSVYLLDHLLPNLEDEIRLKGVEL